jgi:hypothetical protein
LSLNSLNQIAASIWHYESSEDETPLDSLIKTNKNVFFKKIKPNRILVVLINIRLRRPIKKRRCAFQTQALLNAPHPRQSVSCTALSRQDIRRSNEQSAKTPLFHLDIFM